MSSQNPLNWNGHAPNWELLTDQRTVASGDGSNGEDNNQVPTSAIDASLHLAHARAPDDAELDRIYSGFTPYHLSSFTTASTVRGPPSSSQSILNPPSWSPPVSHHQQSFAPAASLFTPAHDNLNITTTTSGNNSANQNQFLPVTQMANTQSNSYASALPYAYYPAPSLPSAFQPLPPPPPPGQNPASNPGPVSNTVPGTGSKYWCDLCGLNRTHWRDMLNHWRTEHGMSVKRRESFKAIYNSPGYQHNPRWGPFTPDQAHARGIDRESRINFYGSLAILNHALRIRTSAQKRQLRAAIARDPVRAESLAMFREWYHLEHAHLDNQDMHNMSMGGGYGWIMAHALDLNLE